MKVRRWLGWLIPAGERELVLRELDELCGRRFGGRASVRASVWYLTQILAFALRLRVERVREMTRGLPGLWSDIAYSMRTLLRRPGYLLAGILTLGIGTGGVAVVYSVADWVLLRDVPGVEDPDGLVLVRLEDREEMGGEGASWGIMDRELRRLRERVSSVESLEGVRRIRAHFKSGPSAIPSRESGWFVTPGYFDALRVRPAIGRFFDPGDHEAGAGPAEVVIGHDLWEVHWDSSPTVVGSEVLINGRPFTVIGVAPEGFHGAEIPGAGSLWFTLSAFDALHPAEESIETAIQFWDPMLGRRRDGVTRDQVEREFAAAVEDIRSTFEVHSFTQINFFLAVYRGIGLDPQFRGRVGRTLRVLFGVSIILMLLAVANVASLGLTRAATRRSDSAIRRALGASSGRVAREPLTEGAIVGSLGGLLALLILLVGGDAWSALQLSARHGIMGEGGVSLDGMRITGTAAAVCVAVAVLAGLLSGVVPAITVQRERVLEWLSGAGHGDPRSARARHAMVVGQIALSCALVVGAGLFARTVVELNRIDLGLVRDAYTFSIDPGLNDYDEPALRTVLSDVRVALRDRLGTTQVGMIFPSPLTGGRITASLKTPGQNPEQVTGRVASQFWTTGNGLFGALGMELIAGEGFEQELTIVDSLSTPLVINEAMARQLLPGVTPEAVIGRRALLGFREVDATIVGVLEDARVLSPRSEPAPLIFRPYDTGFSEGEAAVFLRSGRPEREIGNLVRRTVASVDPALPVYREGTVRGLVNDLLAEQRIVAQLSTVLGAIGLILVALGLYGVLSYAVHERTRELGIRAAMGASADSLRRSVLRRGLGLALAGLLVGLPITAWTTRFVESRLYGVEPLDPISYATGTAVVLGAALLASWLPALRATRISPVEALREE